MNAYERLRRFWTFLPELPNPDHTDLATWQPARPAAEIKANLKRRNVWGYVDPRVRARLDELTAPPPPPTPAEQLARERERFKRAAGATVRQGSGGPYTLGWDAPDGWTPDRYQVLARSVAIHGRQPIRDEVFGPWRKVPDASRPEGYRWQRESRRTWTALGGYDLATGPIRTPRQDHALDLSLLAAVGPGPWQVTVLSWWPPMGGVYGENVLEGGVPTPTADPTDVDPRLPREERILRAVRSYSGPRLKRSGKPHVRFLRKFARMPRITAAERNAAWARLSPEERRR